MKKKTGNEKVWVLGIAAAFLLMAGGGIGDIHVGFDTSFPSDVAAGMSDETALSGSSGTLQAEPGRTGLLPLAVPGSAEPWEPALWEAGGLVYIIVQAGLYSSIQGSIDLLADNIENRRRAPYTVEILSDAWTSHTQVKAALQSGYSQGMVGAILVGDIPTPWYGMWHGQIEDYYERFPIDLYYMDMDGVWGGGDGGSMHDPYTTHTGDLHPEIWVGRLYVDSVSSLGTEQELIEGYLHKVNEYSWGNITRQNRALVYVDDDWYDWADQWDADVGLAYQDRTFLKGKEVNRDDYLGRLPQDYEWISLFAHTGKWYHVLNGTEGYYEPIYNTEIGAASPPALFYNLFCCGASNYSYATDGGYITGHYIFSNTSGLAAVGSAKTGSMLEFQDLYGPLSEGAGIGEAFRQWFNSLDLEIWDGYYKSWTYGMNIIGDPTLEIGGYEIPEPPTNLTVEHWGEANFTETRHLRGIVDEVTVNDLTAYSLNIEQSNNNVRIDVANQADIYCGIRVYSRSESGTMTQLTSAVSAIAGSTTAGFMGIISGTWMPPETALEWTDSIVVEVFASRNSPPTELRGTFTTEQLNAKKLEATEWMVHYFVRRGSSGNPSFIGWGSTERDSRIEGFSYSMSENPLDHNMLNWTASPSVIGHYNIYRSDTEFGTYSLVGSSPSGTDTYTDFHKGQYDEVLWWYIVRADTPGGTEEQNTNAVQEPGPGANNPPNAPANPSPADGATGVSTSPTLSVGVSDPDGDSMTVRFYNAATSTQIGADQTGIASGGTASVEWTGLAESTTYSWYATASDAEFTTQSPTWSFTTGRYYQIDLAGESGWVFVSFPADIAGNVDEILNDGIAGDGLTTWSVAKTYDNLNKRWITYRPGYAAPFHVDNTMGMWLYLTANDGDQVLTVNQLGSFPATAVGINLYAGWNMVSYPSATSRSFTDALAGTGATMVARYTNVSPWIEDITLPSAEMMTHGNAYWVLVPADTPWTVNW